MTSPSSSIVDEHVGCLQILYSHQTFFNQNLPRHDGPRHPVRFGVLGHILGVQLPNLRRWHWMSSRIMSKPYASFPRPELVPTTPPKAMGVRYRYLRPSSVARFLRFGGADGGAGSRSGKQLLGTTGTKKEVWKILGCPWYLG